MIGLLERIYDTFVYLLHKSCNTFCERVKEINIEQIFIKINLEYANLTWYNGRVKTRRKFADEKEIICIAVRGGYDVYGFTIERVPQESRCEKNR